MTFDFNSLEPTNDYLPTRQIQESYLPCNKTAVYLDMFNGKIRYSSYRQRNDKCEYKQKASQGKNAKYTYICMYLYVRVS